MLRAFSAEGRRNQWQLVVSPDGADGSLRIHQDARLFRAEVDAGTEFAHELGTRYAWLQVVRGAVRLDGTSLTAGDAAAVSGEKSFKFRAEAPAEALLFDLA